MLYIIFPTFLRFKIKKMFGTDNLNTFFPSDLNGSKNWVSSGLLFRQYPEWYSIVVVSNLPLLRSTVGTWVQKSVHVISVTWRDIIYSRYLLVSKDKSRFFTVVSKLRVLFAFLRRLRFIWDSTRVVRLLFGRTKLWLRRTSLSSIVFRYWNFINWN